MARAENFGDILWLYFQDMIKHCCRFIAIDSLILLLVFYVRKVYFIFIYMYTT